jgi:hypothetical protein
MRVNLIWGSAFIACMFISFSSAPLTFLIYLPVYSALWAVAGFFIRAERQAIPFRLALLVSAIALFSIIGIPSYIWATAAVTARDNDIPPILHHGMALLTVDFWTALLSRFSTCSGEQGFFLICISKTPVAWIQLIALAGGMLMIIFDKGRPRALAVVVVAMICLLHIYFLLGMVYVLGRVHIVGYHYVYWTLFPLVFAVASAGTGTFFRLLSRNNAAIVSWMPAAANSVISIVFLIIFVTVISVRQPRVAGEGVFGFPPIAHTPVRKGSIHRYLEEHIAITPGKEFRGYAGLYLGADDGFVRKLSPTSDGTMTHDTYVAARDILTRQFGNMFQLQDLWASNIPTLEDYGQWLTKQMFVFNTDLLAGPDSRVDSTGVATHIYEFAPELLAMLGVRYIVSDGSLDSPLITEVAHETSAAATTLRLYEIKNANLGHFSPTKVLRATSYEEAISSLRNLQDTVILLGSTTLPSDIVSASNVRFTIAKGGYHITAQSPGRSLLVLPVQFSHCWRLIERSASKAAILRANIVQTGIYFQGYMDADLQFEFGLLKSSCRKRDGDDMSRYFAKRRSKTSGSIVR